jgi:hypothetical protein
MHAYQYQIQHFLFWGKKIFHLGGNILKHIQWVHPIIRCTSNYINHITRLTIQTKKHCSHQVNSKKIGQLNIVWASDYRAQMNNKYLSAPHTKHPTLHGEVYSIHYVIAFISDLRQVGGFLRVPRFPLPIKLITTK